MQQVSSENNRIYKILEDANIKLSTVMKADSVSGQKVIHALINGETKAENLLRFIHRKTSKQTGNIESTGR